MPRRVDLPGAAELFRNTGAIPEPIREPVPVAPEAARRPTPSGRVRHEEKITVYVSSEELLALEQLRLELRIRHGIAADRGRIVRAAIAEALGDVAEHGANSRFVQRLS